MIGGSLFSKSFFKHADMTFALVEFGGTIFCPPRRIPPNAQVKNAVPILILFSP